MPAPLRLSACLPLLFLAPAWAQNDAEEAKVRASLLAGQYIEGKVADVKADGKMKLVTVEYAHQVKRPGDPRAARKVDFLKALYEKAVASKNQEFINRAGDELAKAQKEAGGVEEVPVPFVLRVDPDTKVRTLVVPLDDNGKPKKLTAEEQRKLKGDPRLPGLTASADSFEENQPVRFYIDRVKYRPVAKSPKTKDAEPPTQLYPVSMVIILPPPAVDMSVNPFTKGIK